METPDWCVSARLPALTGGRRLPTLVACERTGRICAAIELDPVYADVVLARWERFSGQVAGRIDGYKRKRSSARTSITRRSDGLPSCRTCQVSTGMACAVRSSRAAWQQRSRRTPRSASSVAASPGERLPCSRCLHDARWAPVQGRTHETGRSRSPVFEYPAWYRARRRSSRGS